MCSGLQSIDAPDKGDEFEKTLIPMMKMSMLKNANKRDILLVSRRALAAGGNPDCRHLPYSGRHPKSDGNLYQGIQDIDPLKHEYVLKSSDESSKMADRALEALKRKDIKEAVEDCNAAIDILPINANPYILLTKLYLMTGQEEEMFRTLTHAGHSYPDFDKIVSVIDDEDLDKIPVDEPQDGIYLANFPENREMAISFMFDDGQADVYKALPIFEKYGYRATIPVIAGFVAELQAKIPFWGSWKEWRDAANRGFEIANHSMNHRDQKSLGENDFKVSIDQSKELIEKNTGHKVTAYVFPHDSYSDAALNHALKFHKVVRARKFLTSFYHRTVKIIYGGPFFSAQTANRLIDIGIKRRLWLIAECHGVRDKKSGQTFKSITPSFLKQHLAYIHSKPGDVWVDTFSNVFEYLSLRRQTKIVVKALAANSIDFILHNDKLHKLLMPLTVVVKPPREADGVRSASGADGHILKAWFCAADKICVDVDSYDENIHVQWD